MIVTVKMLMLIRVLVIVLVMLMPMLMIVMIMLVVGIVVMVMIMIVGMSMLMMVMVMMVVMLMIVIVMMVMMLAGKRLFGMNMLAGRPFRDICVCRTYDDAQHVRLARQVARPGAVADRFDDHRRKPFGEIVHDGGYDSRTGRSRHLHRIVGRGDRKPAHHFERCRRGYRIQAMVASDRSRAERDRGAINRLGLQRIERQRDADHVDDRIDRAYFVEMHLLERNAVDLALGDSDFFEYGQTVRGDPLVKAGGLDHFDDIRVMPVLGRPVVRIERYVHLERGNPSFVYTLPLQLERLDANFLQLALDIRPIGAGVYERGQRHIAANAGEAIEINDSHATFTTFSTYFC